MNNGLLYFPPGTNPKPNGRILQIVETQDRAGDSTALNFLVVDTAPQITEGKEYTALRTVFTPLSAQSRLSIEALVHCIPSNGTNCSIGLWKNTEPDCLAFALQSIPASSRGQVSFRHFMDSPRAGPILFTVRFGGYTGTASTVRVSSSATPNWGGTQYSSLRITEYMP